MTSAHGRGAAISGTATRRSRGIRTRPIRTHQSRCRQRHTAIDAVARAVPHGELQLRKAQVSVVPPVWSSQIPRPQMFLVTGGRILAVDATRAVFDLVARSVLPAVIGASRCGRMCRGRSG
jgi:hypothetical protein